MDTDQYLKTTLKTDYENLALEKQNLAELLKQKTILLQREQNQGFASLTTAGTAMDIDSASQRAPPFVRTKSDEEFIQTNNLDLRKPEDSLTYLIHFLEKYMSYKDIILPNNANFHVQTCLEHRLDERATKYVPNLVDNVKLVLAVSGAGKTRMLLELLYSTCGYYFTAKSSLKDFGSADLGECRVHCDYNPQDAKRAIQLLYFIRVSVCNYLISKGFGDPKLGATFLKSYLPTW